MEKVAESTPAETLSTEPDTIITRTFFDEQGSSASITLDPQTGKTYIREMDQEGNLVGTVRGEPG